MTVEFCDWSPCPWLKRLLESFLLRGERYVVAIQIVSTGQPLSSGESRRNSPQGSMGLNLWYCPFCGVRIHDNKDILAWISQRMRPSELMVRSEFQGDPG
jgi:hypothetical protein